MSEDMGASAEADRAVVNGAASVSAVPASVPSAVATVKRLLPLLTLITVRQAIEAGDDVIDACGINPWCINEGLADGSEPAMSWWQVEEIDRALDTLAQAIEARRAETGTGSVHESAVRKDAPESPLP